MPLAHGAAMAPPFIVRAPAMELIDANMDESFGDGDSVEVTITFNEQVEVVTTDGTPSLYLRVEDIFAEIFASYVRGSGSTTLVFSYTKAAADVETSQFAPVQILLNGGKIKSKATDVDAEIRFVYRGIISTDFSAQSNQRAAPAVVGAPALSEAGADGAWTAGETVEVKLPRRAVAPLALLEDLPDLGPEPVTPGSAFGSLWGRTPPGVEPAVSNPQDPAHEPDGVPGSMGGDESVLRLHVFAAH